MVGAVSEITEAEIDEIAGEAALRFIAPSSIAPPFMIACGRPRESRARPWTPCEMSASHGGIRCSVPAVDHKPY
jgi:hypothetical protein